jgi:hypothetical protein
VYNLTGPLSGLRVVDVELGRGADWFTANLTGQSLTAGANLDIGVSGNGGGDTMVLNAHGVSTDLGSILNVFFDGDGGKDAITLDYSAGVELGTLNLGKDQRH